MRPLHLPSWCVPGLALSLAACTCVSTGKLEVFACDQGACPSGLTCCPDDACHAVCPGTGGGAGGGSGGDAGDDAGLDGGLDDAGSDAGADGGMDGGVDGGGCGMCTGCCSDGGCQLGSADTACGYGGIACVSCISPQLCTGGFCIASSCTGCITSSGLCTNGAAQGQCGLGGITCVACSSGQVCASGLCQDAGACTPVGGPCNGPGDCCTAVCLGNACATPTGDTCGRALPLAFADGGVARATNDTTAYADNFTASGCSADGGRDVYYAFSLAGPTPQNVTAEVTPDGGWPVAVAIVRADCTTSVSCSAMLQSGSVSTATTLGAGSYYAVVDAAMASAAGAFDLTVTQIPQPVFGETCRTPEPLGNSWSTVNGTTLGYLDDEHVGACGDSGPDRVYSITLTTPQALTIDLTSGSPADYKPVVTLYDGQAAGCLPSDLLGCTVDSTSAPHRLVTGVLGAGTYYLVVDGESGTSGPFTLDVRGSPGEGCGLLPDLLPQQPVTYISGTTSGRTGEMTATCGGSGPDVAYAFSGAMVGSTFRAALSMGDSHSIVYLRAPGVLCPVMGMEVACENSQRNIPANLNVAIGLTGQYTLWVDSETSAQAGPYDLTVAWNGAPLPGDSCSTPIALGVLARPTTMSLLGSTVGATSDVATSSCGSVSGPDIGYVFTTTAPGVLSVRVVPNETARPAVYLRPADCTGTDIACGLASTGGQPATIATNLSAGTWLLMVDTAGTATFGYRLDLSFQ